jgi:hypothetical protein
VNRWYYAHWAAPVALLVLGGCSKVIGADGAVFDERPECVVHADCDKFDRFDPHTCVEGSCVALRNDGPEGGDCRLVLGQAGLTGSEPPFVFGVISDVQSVEDDLSATSKLFDFAMQEFERRGGITLAGKTRAPVAVVCNGVEATDEELERTFDHLTGRLKVPGIITPLRGTTLKRHFERVHLDQRKSVFFLSPVESDPLFANIDDDGELWHVLGPPTAVGFAYPPLIRRAENYVNPPGEDGTRPPIRLALINDNTSLTSELANVVERELTLNGSSASENGPDYYRRYALGTPDDSPAALEDLLDFKPHIVVSVMFDDFMSQFLLPIEVNWPEDAGQPRPFYVLSPLQVDAAYLLELVSAFPDSRTRMAGVSLASALDSPVYQTFRRNVSAAYPGEDYLPNMENYYDAMYFFLYAAAASNAERPSGAALARGMQRLVRGEPQQMGQEQIPAVLAMLNASESSSVALEGALGPPDFDVSTGMRLSTPSSAFCIAEQDGLLSYRHNVLLYDRERDELVGDFDCFPGFPAE